jgi:hypothetical protein
MPTTSLCFFDRIMLKVSGEALQGSHGFGIDPKILEGFAREIKAAHDKGIQIAVVVGGGNYFRGASAWDGLERATADYVGMLATVMNALCLQVRTRSWHGHAAGFCRHLLHCRCVVATTSSKSWSSWQDHHPRQQPQHYYVDGTFIPQEPNGYEARAPHCCNSWPCTAEGSSDCSSSSYWVTCKHQCGDAAQAQPLLSSACCRFAQVTF